VALAECCVAGGMGARVEAEVDLFGEAPGTAYVVSGPGAAELGRVIGRVGGDRLEVVGRLEVAVSELAMAREQGLVSLLA
jgi:hypothetical protein